MTVHYSPETCHQQLGEDDQANGHVHGPVGLVLACWHWRGHCSCLLVQSQPRQCWSSSKRGETGATGKATEQVIKSSLQMRFLGGTVIKLRVSYHVMNSRHMHELYHRSSSGTRTCCGLLIFFTSAAAVVMCVLGIVCLASSGQIGYCTVMSVGGFISLLVVGVAIAVFCCIFICCVVCCVDSAERVTLVESY
jgi:hypothetical protein